MYLHGFSKSVKYMQHPYYIVGYMWADMFAWKVSARTFIDNIGIVSF